MRLLCTFAGGWGHAAPLVPIAEAARSAGHNVAFAGRASALSDLPQRGFAVFAEPAAGASPQPVMTPLRTPNQRREQRVLRDYFAGRLAQSRAVHIRSVCQAFAADVIVCDEVDFGGMIAAEASGIPHATVLVTAAGFVQRRVLAASLDQVRAAHGLPPDPQMTMPQRHLVLNPFPPSLRGSDAASGTNSFSFRASWTRADTEPEAPAWLAAWAGAPTVYFTLGTEFNTESGDLFDRALAVLSRLPLKVIVTVGSQIDPAQLGAQPANVRVARYLSQSLILPRCRAVISHGGSGTVTAALSAGLPLVLLPMGADQPLNAARCAAIGAGVVLDAMRTTGPQIERAVTTVLSDPAYRAAAARVEAEVAALPAPSQAWTQVERLVLPPPAAAARSGRRDAW